MTHRPAGTYHPPAADQVTADQQRRLTQLEQRPQPGAYVPEFCLTATNGGPLTADVETYQTGPWYPDLGAVRLFLVRVSAIDVDAPTTLTLRRSGSTVATFDVVEGTQRQGFDEHYSPSDWVDLTLSGVVGTIQVQMWFRGPGGGNVEFAAPTGGDA